MELQHVAIKIFLRHAVDLSPFVGIFNGWIQTQWTPELLVDVADYQHVYAGPGVILIGHEANYALDNTDNRLGLLYTRKARVEGAAQEALQQAARAVLLAAHRLERENGVAFDPGNVQIIVNDRYLAPNSPETLARLKPELEAFLQRWYGGAAFTWSTPADPRERFAVTITVQGDVSLANLLYNLGVEETVIA